MKGARMKKLVGFDIETFFIVNQVAPQPVCVSLYSEGQKELYKADEGCARLKELLRDDQVELCGQIDQGVFWQVEAWRELFSGEGEIHDGLCVMGDSGLVTINGRSFRTSYLGGEIHPMVLSTRDIPGSGECWCPLSSL